MLLHALGLQVEDTCAAKCPVPMQALSPSRVLATHLETSPNYDLLVPFHSSASKSASL